LTIANARYTAQLQTRRIKDNWTLASYSLGAEGRLDKNEEPLPDVIFCDLSPHLCYRHIRLSKLFSTPSIQIMELERIMRDTKEATQITLEGLTKPPEPLDKRPAAGVLSGPVTVQ
jgi:hypothetical protein